MVLEKIRKTFNVITGVTIFVIIFIISYFLLILVDGDSSGDKRKEK